VVVAHANRPQENHLLAGLACRVCIWGAELIHAYAGINPMERQRLAALTNSIAVGSLPEADMAVQCSKPVLCGLLTATGQDSPALHECDNDPVCVLMGQRTRIQQKGARRHETAQGDGVLWALDMELVRSYRLFGPAYPCSIGQPQELARGSGVGMFLNVRVGYSVLDID
jgi:hypothetical protein